MKKIFKKLIILGILIVFFIILNIIKSIPSWASFYSFNIASFFIMISGSISSLIPFSIYELFLLVAISYIMYFIIILIRKLIKKEFFKVLEKTLTFIIVITLSLNWYLASASISYNRDQLPIMQYQGEVSDALINDTIEYFIDDYNSISKTFARDKDGFIQSPYTLEETIDIIKEEYKRLDPNYFPSYTPDVKLLISSAIFSELHFTGVFFAPFGEINLNSQMHAIEIPYVTAHEIAHAKGVTREDDANLVSLYINLTSSNPYLRYSAYYWSFLSLLDIYNLTNKELYYHYINKLDPAIITEINGVYKFWNERNILDKFGDFFNNVFLKVNGNENVTDDYNDTSTSEDTGKTDENDNPIYEITEYSPYQKLYFAYYLSLKEN